MKDDLLIFGEYREALYRALYEDNVSVPNIGLFMIWAKKELPNSQSNLGMNSEDFLKAVVKIITSNEGNILEFYNELDSRRHKKILFLLLDKTKQLEILNDDPEALEFFKDANRETIEQNIDFFISIAKNSRHPNQYLAISLLSKIIDRAEVKELYKELLYDWDENVRRAVLISIRDNPDKELVEYIKVFSSEEEDDINLKIIKDILDDGRKHIDTKGKS